MVITLHMIDEGNLMFSTLTHSSSTNRDIHSLIFPSLQDRAIALDRSMVSFFRFFKITPLPVAGCPKRNVLTKYCHQLHTSLTNDDFLPFAFPSCCDEMNKNKSSYIKHLFHICYLIVTTNGKIGRLVWQIHIYTSLKRYQQYILFYSAQR